MITFTPDPSTLLGTTFVNQGRVRAKGLELEGQMRLGPRVHGLMSYALQRAEDVDTGRPLANSPGQIGKVRFSVPGPFSGSFLSLEVLSRISLADKT